VLDKHHAIETGRIFPVCGNTWRMLQDSRFAEHFTFVGDFSQHFRLFEGCGFRLPFDRGAFDRRTFDGRTFDRAAASEATTLESAPCC
jgi:hypothetical protein